MSLDLASPVTERPPRQTTDGADMPDALARWVREIPASLSVPARYVMAAGFLIAYYLKPELLEDGRDSFLNLRRSAPEWHAGSRLVSVAEALYVLRDQDRFASLCDRVRDLDLGSVFFEASVARRFAEAGFQITSLTDRNGATSRSGFAANTERDRISVLMLRLTTQRFSAAATRAGLERAAEATPVEGPSFLCCYYPASWVLDCWDIDFSLGEVATQFLKAHRNLNQIGFYREEFADLEEGNAHSLVGFVERNAAPRSPSAALERVVAGSAMGPRAEPLARPKFFDWVDCVLASKA